MAKTAHKRKKTVRVTQWAIYSELTNRYLVGLNNEVLLYGIKGEADTQAWAYRDKNEPCRVDRVEVRKI